MIKRMIRTRQGDAFNVLTNDPSLTAWGWAVVSASGHVLDAGCIKTKPEAKKRRIRKGDDDVRRISEINQQLKNVIETYHISYIISEQPHGSKSATAMKMVGIVEAILQTFSNLLNISIEWYSEGDAKKALFGRSSATKEETINAISKLYQVPWTFVEYQDEAIADALAIHNCAVQQSPIIKFYINKNVQK